MKNYTKTSAYFIIEYIICQLLWIAMHYYITLLICICLSSLTFFINRTWCYHKIQSVLHHTCNPLQWMDTPGGPHNQCKNLVEQAWGSLHWNESIMQPPVATFQIKILCIHSSILSLGTISIVSLSFSHLYYSTCT